MDVAVIVGITLAVVATVMAVLAVVTGIILKQKRRR